jgi:hypothetical protein
MFNSLTQIIKQSFVLFVYTSWNFGLMQGGSIHPSKEEVIC